VCSSDLTRNTRNLPGPVSRILPPFDLPLRHAHEPAATVPPRRACRTERAHHGLGRVGAGLRRAVHVALEIVAAVFAGEEEIAHRHTLRSRNRRPLPGLVAGVTALRPWKGGPVKARDLPVTRARRSRVRAINPGEQSTRRVLGRALPR